MNSQKMDCPFCQPLPCLRDDHGFLAWCLGLDESQADTAVEVVCDARKAEFVACAPPTCACVIDDQHDIVFICPDCEWAMAVEDEEAAAVALAAVSCTNATDCDCPFCSTDDPFADV